MNEEPLIETDFETELRPETLNTWKRHIDAVLHRMKNIGEIENVDSIAFHHYKLAITHLMTAREHVALAKIHRIRGRASG